MMLFIFKTYIRFLQWLCAIGVTKQWDSGGVFPGFGCWPFDTDSWIERSRYLVAGPLEETFHVIDVSRQRYGKYCPNIANR